jgi:hypothetical protein
VPGPAANTWAVAKRKEESLIEEMRAALAHDREQLGRRGSPLAAPSPPEPEPPVEQVEEPGRKPLLSRLLRRDG